MDNIYDASIKETGLYRERWWLINMALH